MEVPKVNSWRNKAKCKAFSEAITSMADDDEYGPRVRAIIGC